MSKKMMLIAAAAILLTPALASAQLATGSVSASATVAAYAAVTGTQDLNFGTLSRSSNTVVDPAGSANAGLRTLDYNNNIRVSITTPANLQATVGGSTVNLPVTFSCASRIGTGSWTTAACTTIDLDAGTAMTQATLGFGGTITSASIATLPAATYSGTITFSVVAR